MGKYGRVFFHGSTASGEEVFRGSDVLLARLIREVTTRFFGIFGRPKTSNWLPVLEGGFRAGKLLSKWQVLVSIRWISGV